MNRMANIKMHLIARLLGESGAFFDGFTSMDIFFAVMGVCRHDPDSRIDHPKNYQLTVKAAFLYDISPLTVGKRRDISEKFGTFGDICHQIQKVQDRGKSKPDAHAVSSKER